MSDTNPYEAPRSDLSHTRPEAGARGGVLADKAMAERLLMVHDRGAYTPGLFLGWNARQYLVVAVVVAAGLGILAAAGLWVLFYVVLGWVIGSRTRDLEWLRAMQKTWSFTERVTDWDKVRSMADGRGVS